MTTLYTCTQSNINDNTHTYFLCIFLCGKNRNNNATKYIVLWILVTIVKRKASSGKHPMQSKKVSIVEGRPVPARWNVRLADREHSLLCQLRNLQPQDFHRIMERCISTRIFLFSLFRRMCYQQHYCFLYVCPTLSSLICFNNFP